MINHSIKVCASRLPPDEAEQFLKLMEDAGKLFRAAIDVRARAWAIYHRWVPAKGASK